MRFLVKDSERRPDPEPLKTDDRKVVLVGLAAWIVATIVLLASVDALAADGLIGLLWTSLIGLVLGVALLVYVHVRRRA